MKRKIVQRGVKAIERRTPTYAVNDAKQIVLLFGKYEDKTLNYIFEHDAWYFDYLLTLALPQIVQDELERLNQSAF